MAHRRNNEILARYAVPLERFAGPAPLDGWSRLAANSAFASIVHNPVWLGAMMQHLGTGRKSVHLVRAGNKENPVAIAALSKTGIPHILPGHSVVSTWDCGFMMSGMPLLERGDPEGALVALIEEAQRQTGASAILLRKVPDYPKLAAWLGKNSIATAIFAPHRRAALSCTGSYDDWFEGNFSRKRRKEYRRLRNRLAETGKLQSISLAPGDDIERWVDEFAVLEASGWKGKRGTAVACNPAKVIFLKQAFAALREKNQLRLWKITLDDRPVAMLFGFAENGQGWLGKMAYDETLSQYSPGVLVILDATRSLFDDPCIAAADSCADPDHPMIDNIWRDRLPTGDILISAPQTHAAVFERITKIEAAYRQARQTARAVYYLLRRGLKK